MTQQKKLPTLAEIHGDIDLARDKDQLKKILNQPPPEKWLRNHPLAKVKNDQGQTVAARYMPVDKTEYLLDTIFQDWKIEVLREGVMFQSVYCTVRLHYLNPMTQEWMFHDGVGAKSVQVNQGASASDLGQIKDAAVQMALPAAKSFAIKDAADHLGKIFGRDINRQYTADFTGAYEFAPEPKQETSQNKISTKPNNLFDQL